jgi:membrane protein DedA with SNARE-associated domain
VRYAVALRSLRHWRFTAKRHGHDRRHLFLLLAPVIVLFAAGVIGTAFAPVLLARAPLLLIAMSPLFRHLVLASSSIDPVPFVAVAIVRLFAADPFLYVIGREYGPEAVDWVKSRSRAAGRVMRFAERAFARAGVLVLFVSPGPLVCLLAGVERMPLTTFVAVNLLGTATAVLLIRSFGITFAAKLELVRQFIAANIVGLTIVSVLLVLARIAAKRRRRAHA